MNLKNLLKVTLALVVLVLFASSASFAQVTYYVNSVSGLDGYNGLSATVQGGGVGPKLTIQNAVNAASDGDIISVAGNTGVPFNIEPTGTITITNKTLTFVVTPGAATPVIDADFVLNDASAAPGTAGIDFNGGFQFAAGRNFSVQAGAVRGAANLTFNGTTIVRYTNNTSFDAAVNIVTGSNLSLVYQNANITVGPEWLASGVANVTALQAGGNKLTLNGNKTISGVLTTTAGGVLELGSSSLTLSNAGPGVITHANAANITSTDVSTGEIVFVGDGNVTWNGAGNVPSLRKAGKGAVTIAAATTVNGSVKIDAVAGNMSLPAATTVAGGITNNGTGTLLFSADAASVFCNSTGSVLNSSDGSINFAPATLPVSYDIKGNVENSGKGAVTFSNNCTARVRGNLTLSAAEGSITVGTAPMTIDGSVVNTGTLTITDVKANVGNIVFGAANHSVGQGVLLSKVVINNLPKDKAATTNVANITFGAGVITVGGTVTNRVNIQGSRVSNEETIAEGGINTSGNIMFLSTTQNLTIGGGISNEATTSFVVGGTTAGTDGTVFQMNGNILFASTSGNLAITGIVKNSSTGFTFTNAVAPAPMGSILASGLTSGTLTVGGIENSSTNTNEHGNIDFNAASTGAITINGDVKISGAAGTGDIILGTGTTVVTGDVSNAKAVANADIIFNMSLTDADPASADVALGSLSNTGKSKITFANTTATLSAGSISVSDGSITMANTTGAIAITNSISVSGGSLVLGAAASTAAISVGANVQLTAGTIDLGTGVRTVTVFGPTVEFKVGATFSHGAATTLIFQGSVPQVVNVSSGGTFVFPGSVTVNNQIVPSNNAWTLANGNLRANGSVTFTKGQANIGNNYLFILGNFANNVSSAESYVTGTNGFISMQNGGAANNVTKTGAAKFSNFEVDNALGAVIGVNNSVNDVFTFTGAFNLTNGTVTAFTDADDADVIELNNAANPPTIYRNAGGFFAAPTFTSIVNVSYIGGSKTFSNEVPTALSGKLNNLTIATTGTSTVTANVNFKVNGAATVNAGQVLDLVANTMTMDSVAGASASVITLNGNAKIVANNGGVIALNRAGGTAISGTSMTTADANTLPAISVLANSKNNTISGVRSLVDAGAAAAGLTVAAGGSIAVAFVNQAGITPPAPANIEGNIANAGAITLNSAVRVAGNFVETAGSANLGANNLRIDGNTNQLDGNAAVTSTGGYVQLMGGVGTFTVTTKAATIPYLEINLGAAGNVLEIVGNTLVVSNTLQHTQGTLQLTSGDLKIAGNTYTVADIEVASINGAGANTLELKPASGTVTWTLNDPTPATPPAAYSIAKIKVDGNVTLAGTATGGMTISGSFTHASGELNFGARNITLTGTSTFARTGGTYSATTGYLIYNSTGAFNEGTGFSIPNFRVSSALNPADDKDFVVQNALDLNNATLTHAVGTAAKLSVGVAGGSVPTITVTSAGNVDLAPVFAQGNVNYVFAGAALTVDDNAKYWPNTAALAKDVTLNMGAAATAVTFNKARTINGNLILTKGTFSIATTITVNVASGSTVTVTEASSIVAAANATSGTFSAPSIDLVYDVSAVTTPPVAAIAASGVELTAPGVINNLTANNGVTLVAARTISGVLTINADVTINNATTDKNTVAAGDVVIANGKTLTISGGNSLTAKANVTMNGSATTAGAGTLVFGGAANQTFAMGQATTVVNLTINQTADAKVSVTGGNLQVGNAGAGSLTLTRGLLEIASGKTLTLAGALQGFTRGGTSKSHVIGNVMKTIPAAAGRYEFPVGSADFYRPAAFTFTTAPIFAFNLTVNHVASSPEGNTGLPIQDGANTITGYPDFYWFISSNTNLGSAINFNLELTGTGYTVQQPVTSIRIIRRVDGDAVINEWSLQGGNYDNYLVGTDPTITNISSQGGINPAGARFTYGLSGSGSLTVSGTVKYDNGPGTNMSGVTVTLTPATGTARTATTNAQGQYSFANVANGTYTVTASSTVAWAPTSASDALLVAKQFAGTATLTGLKLVAADVNNSNTVNNTDALLILKRSANPNAVTFAKGNWVFTSADVVVNNANATADLRGLATGDVNASGMSTLAKASVQVTNNSKVDLAKKNAINLPVKAVSDMNVGAMQLTFKYPAEMVSFEGVSSKAENIQVYDDQNGKVVLAWADLSGKDGIDLKAGDALVTLQFKSKEELKAGSKVNVELNGAASEIANKLGEVSNATLDVASLEVVKPTEFALSNNYPNPFNPSTTIRYELPVNARVSLVVFNTLGEQVATLVNAQQEVGRYEVNFNASNLTSGVYFYRLIVNAGEQNFTQTHKMILMK